MKKRLLFSTFAAIGLCAVAALASFCVTNIAMSPPQRATRAAFKKMFPGDSRQVFENADRFILYSVTSDLDVPQKNLGTFHELYITGKTEIADRKTRAALVSQLYDGVESYIAKRLETEARTGLKVIDSGFFNPLSPRHAIRAVKGRKTVDLVICFRCSGIQTFYGEKSGQSLTTDVPQKLYDSVLTQAGVPLAP